MSIRTRLVRLERAFPDTGPQHADNDVDTPTDAREADRTGKFLWLTPDWDGRCQVLTRNPMTTDKAAAFRAWDRAAKAARAAGQTAYHAGLAPYALAVWRTMQADILEHRQTHGTWLRVPPPDGEELPTPEQFGILPLSKRIRVPRSPSLWPGYWSRIGPGNRIRR
jgi:hypothetical protein